MGPIDNNEFERKSSFLNKHPFPIDAHPKIKKKYKRPGHLKERIPYEINKTVTQLQSQGHLSSYEAAPGSYLWYKNLFK